MAVFDPNSGDLDYLKIIAQNIGNVTNEFQLFRQQLYQLVGTATLKNFGFVSVNSFSDLPTPTKPSFGFTEDTGSLYFYGGGNWKEISFASPAP